MKITSKILILFLSINLISYQGTAQETNSKKSTSNFDFSTVDKFRETKQKGQIINDYVSIFSPSQRQELSDILYHYNIETTRQIVIVTIDSISPYSDIQKFGTDLSNYWGVGDIKKNNGLTIILCNSCRQISIVTGTGTQKKLTDEICNDIINQTIIPDFKNGDFYLGIKNGVAELIKKWG